MSMLKSPSLTLSMSHSHTLALSHSLIHSLSTCWTTFVFMSMLKSHPHTFSLSLSLAISLSHYFNLSFNHSRHAKQVLFSSLCSKLTVYCWKLQFFFLDHHLLIIITLTCYFRCHRAGSQLKIHHETTETTESSRVLWAYIQSKIMRPKMHHETTETTESSHVLWAHI